MYTCVRDVLVCASGCIVGACVWGYVYLYTCYGYPEIQLIVTSVLGIVAVTMRLPTAAVAAVVTATAAAPCSAVGTITYHLGLHKDIS